MLDLVEIFPEDNISNLFYLWKLSEKAKEPTA
jgi:hypothetical protein